MYDWFVPCSAFLFIFALGFCFTCWLFKHWYYRKLDRRISQLERRLTQPVPQYQQPRYQQRVTRSRYITVDHELNPDFVTEE
jgi:hypothetical protein